MKKEGIDMLKDKLMQDLKDAMKGWIETKLENGYFDSNDFFFIIKKQ